MKLDTQQSVYSTLTLCRFPVHVLIATTCGNSGKAVHLNRRYCRPSNIMHIENAHRLYAVSRLRTCVVHSLSSRDWYANSGFQDCITQSRDYVNSKITCNIHEIMSGCSRHVRIHYTNWDEPEQAPHRRYIYHSWHLRYIIICLLVRTSLYLLSRTRIVFRLLSLHIYAY